MKNHTVIGIDLAKPFFKLRLRPTANSLQSIKGLSDNDLRQEKVAI